MFSDRGRRMGLIVDEIDDIVEQRLDIEVASERPGLVGYAIVKGMKPPRSSTSRISCRKPMPAGAAGRDPRPLPAVRRIMLVDDSAFFRDMLAPLIKAAGYHVTSAASAAEALAAIRLGAGVDVVVTDIEMPDMDGFELAAALRHDPATAGIPVIALSAMVSTDAIERGRRVGLPILSPSSIGPG